MPTVARLAKQAALARAVKGPECPRCGTDEWTDWAVARTRWRRHCRTCGRIQSHRSETKPPADLPIATRH